jgi:hypothetical membrane protein
MHNKLWLLCGPLAALVYVLTVIAGGALHPGYSHLAQPVSDLIAAGAPNKGLLDALFFLYNLLALGFGLGLLHHVRASRLPGGQTVGWAAALALVAEGVFGLLTLAFPEDAGGLGAAIGPSGAGHIIFAGLSALTSILALLLMGLWFWRGPRQMGLAWYSIGSTALVFVAGGLSAATVASHSPIGGLMERLTIGAFILWLAVVGARLSAAHTEPAVPRRTEALVIGSR